MGRVRRHALARSPDPASSHSRPRQESARDDDRQDGMFLATSLATFRVVLRLTGIARGSGSTLGPGGPRGSYEDFGGSIVPCVAHGGGVTPRGSGFVRDTRWQFTGCMADGVSRACAGTRRRLDELMSVLQTDDRLVVSELSRLGRSLGQIVAILDALAKRGVSFAAIKENIRARASRTSRRRS